MKAFMIASMIAAGSMAATSSQAQVYVRAGIGLRVPGPRVYVAPAPIVTAPAPVYDEDQYVDPYAEPFPADEGYAPPVDFYYNYPAYPAWNGHFRDGFYFAHYRPWFERYRAEHFRGHYGGRPGVGYRDYGRGGYGHRDFGRGGFERGGFGHRDFGRGGFERGGFERGGNGHGGFERGEFERGGHRR